MPPTAQKGLYGWWLLPKFGVSCQCTFSNLHANRLAIVDVHIAVANMNVAATVCRSVAATFNDCVEMTGSANTSKGARCPEIT